MSPVLTLHYKCTCYCRRGCSTRPRAIKNTAFLYFNAMHCRKMYSMSIFAVLPLLLIIKVLQILHLALVDKMCPHAYFIFLPWLESHMKTNSESEQTGEEMICIHTLPRGVFSTICSLGQLVSSVCLSVIKH